MLASFASLAVLLAAQDFTPFLAFVRAPSMVGDPESVEIGVLRGQGRLQFWFRRTVESEGGNIITWTDTRRCPAARDAVVAATQIAPPRIYVPGIPVRPDGSTILTLDGIRYELRAGAHYDSYTSSDISFSSNMDTPLANWVEGTLTVLEKCWSDEVPIQEEEAQAEVVQEEVEADAPPPIIPQS
ncbi:hypothetical protein [Erythrobacter alti]|uniref:hypothetical protein n=1 Tax=Erythrobacter alti TaxID=1896145 RepID=UPI0030F47409